MPYWKCTMEHHAMFLFLAPDDQCGRTAMQCIVMLACTMCLCSTFACPMFSEFFSTCICNHAPHVHVNLMAVANRLNLAQTDMLSLGNNSCFVEPLFLLAAMSFSDSEAVFFQRCREIGFEDEAIDNMKNQQLTTMSRFAFACNYSPAGTDEAPLVNLAKEVYGKDPSTVEMAFIRRIFNEAYVNVASDIKSKAESTDETPIRKLAPAERSERLKQQQQRLRGINISGPLEPGDSLIDKCISIYESDRIQYVSWESAVSREHELLTGLKRDTQLTFDGSGTLKLQKANQVEPCNTSSEIQVKYALTRRALAFEQANLVKFSLMEAWSEKMMQCRLEEPSSGFARTTMKQLEQADRKLFVVLGEHTREGIKANTAGRPIDLILKNACSHRKSRPFCSLDP